MFNELLEDAEGDLSLDSRSILEGSWIIDNQQGSDEKSLLKERRIEKADLLLETKTTLLIGGLLSAPAAVHNFGDTMKMLLWGIGDQNCRDHQVVRMRH